MENDEEELLEFIELQDNLKYFDCLPICFYGGIWYIYYERVSKIEVLDYYRLDIPKLPRHIRELTDEDVPNELFFGKKWLPVKDCEFLSRDCAEIAHYFDEIYQDKFIYKYHVQKEASTNNSFTEKDFDLFSNFLV